MFYSIIKTKISAFCLLIVISACQGDDCCQIDPENEMVSSWLLFERGYSPGSGYLVEPVSETPAQTMELRNNGQFSSNIQGLEQYRYFLMLEDDDWEVLALFENEPSSEDQNLDRQEHSYQIEYQENGTVKLYFRFCIEGCHLGLRKIDN